MMCEEPLRGPEVSTVVEWGTRDEIAGPHKDQQKHLTEEAFMVTLTLGAQYNAWHLPWTAKTVHA